MKLRHLPCVVLHRFPPAAARGFRGWMCGRCQGYVMRGDEASRERRKAVLRGALSVVVVGLLPALVGGLLVATLRFLFWLASAPWAGAAPLVVATIGCLAALLVFLLQVAAQLQKRTPPPPAQLRAVTPARH